MDFTFSQCQLVQKLRYNSRMSSQDTVIQAREPLSGLAKAREAARLKREKKAAAVLARQQGKIKAEEKRQEIADAYQVAWAKCAAELEAKISKARKALGVRNNEPNPIGLLRMIEQWKFEIFYGPMRTI